AVDFYLTMCAERGKMPDRPMSDAVAVRLDPELYSQLQTVARNRDTSLETVVVEALRSAMSDAP
ncbi:MAG: toxin-antitoxin system HicB family antitoxin, partial [Isosphaeraceae bacterium]